MGLVARIKLRGGLDGWRNVDWKHFNFSAFNLQNWNCAFPVEFWKQISVRMRQNGPINNVTGSGLPLFTCSHHNQSGVVGISFLTGSGMNTTVWGFLTEFMIRKLMECFSVVWMFGNCDRISVDWSLLSPINYLLFIAPCRKRPFHHSSYSDQRLDWMAML